MDRRKLLQTLGVAGTTAAGLSIGASKPASADHGYSIVYTPDGVIIVPDGEPVDIYRVTWESVKLNFPSDDDGTPDRICPVIGLTFQITAPDTYFYIRSGSFSFRPPTGVDRQATLEVGQVIENYYGGGVGNLTVTSQAAEIDGQESDIIDISSERVTSDIGGRHEFKMGQYSVENEGQRDIRYAYTIVLNFEYLRTAESVTDA